MTDEWQNALRQAVDRDSRIAVLGIGHELCGDDAVGSLVVRALKPLLRDTPHILLIDAGNAPENHTGAIRAFKPDLVLLIDAAFMDAPPGTIRWLLPDQITGSGHHLPLSVLAAYLTGELACRVAVLGIQPASTAVDAPVTPAVMEASSAIVAALQQMSGVPAV